MSRPGLLAIGADGAWRARMQRVFALRSETCWLGAYASGESRRRVAQLPALLLLDGDDPATDRIRRRPLLPAPRRLCFYRHPDVAALERCVSTHASGCLDKQLAVDALLRAVVAAESGLFITSPPLLEAVLEATGDAPPLPRVVLDDQCHLTGRQREIAAQVACGLSNKEIARALAISPETVKAHLHSMFEREGVHGRTALLAALRKRSG